MSEFGNEPKSVLIVGASISGCSAAITAINMGHDVRVVETRSRDDIIVQGRTSFEALQNLTPRGDALDHLANMGLKITSVYPYKGAEIMGPNGASLDFRLNRTHGYFIRRRGKGSLDHQMIDKVERFGTEIEFSTRFLNIEENGTVIINGLGGKRSLHPDIVIGADGLGSNVGKGISKPLRKDEIAIGIGCHFKGDHSFEPGIAQCWLGSDLCPGEYAYVLPSEDEVSVVTTMRPHMMKKGSRPKDYLDRFLRNPLIKEGLGDLESVNMVSGGVPVTGGGPLGRGNIILVGEAARLTDPMLGFGMMNSLISGHVAGSYISSPDPLKYYEGRIREMIMKDLGSRLKTRKRIIDRADDGTINDVLVLADKVMGKVAPDNFFDKDSKKGAMVSSIPTIVRNGGIRLSMNLLLPLIRTNYSFI